MNLLQVTQEDLIQKTTVVRKLTLGGKTSAYPVYRVRLDQVFYNDQNDRIATWISQYKIQQGKDAFRELSKERLNEVIEEFIVQSNPGALDKTKNNINLVGQREAGVVLSDGRIIDGNRRFTCLRLLQKYSDEPLYFDTVILDDTKNQSEKHIKMLELSIQHGEEQRVDYNHIDLAIGAYRDIEVTNLLTIQEYAESTNESIAEVKKRLQVAQMVVDFLAYMGIPEQYHVAREMQVYSVFGEALPVIRNMKQEEDANTLKLSIFNNIMMGSFADHRRYIRNVKAMQDSGVFQTYLKEQASISEMIQLEQSQVVIQNKNDLDRFVKRNEELKHDLQYSLDQALHRTKKEKTKEQPVQILSKSISLLEDLDTRIIEHLNDADRNRVKAQLEKLNETISLIEEEVSDDILIEEEEQSKLPTLGNRHRNEPYVYIEGNTTITNLIFSINISAIKTETQQNNKVSTLLVFLDEDAQPLCEEKEIVVEEGSIKQVNFSLDAKASTLDHCYLIMKSKQDAPSEAQQRYAFQVEMSFVSDFDF